MYRLRAMYEFHPPPYLRGIELQAAPKILQIYAILPYLSPQGKGGRGSSQWPFYPDLLERKICTSSFDTLFIAQLYKLLLSSLV